MSGEPIVPFGKYRGRPVTDMLADQDYMDWLEAQPWFRQRFAGLADKQQAEAYRLRSSPEHNRMQALFLARSYRWSFIYANAFAHAWNRRRTNTHPACRPNGRIVQFNSEYNDPVLSVGRIEPRFEVSGADVSLIYVSVPRTEDALSFLLDYAYLHETKDALRIEVKPTVGDDYPAILRQMGRNNTDYLFVGSYIGEGATERQFVEIFELSDKHVVFKRDVDRIHEQPSTFSPRGLAHDFP